jgi:hypothetical protein
MEAAGGVTAAEVLASRLVDRLLGDERRPAILHPIDPSRRAEYRRAIEREARRRGREVFAIYRRRPARIEAFLLPREEHA